MPTDVLRDATRGAAESAERHRQRAREAQPDRGRVLRLPRDARRLVEPDVGDRRVHRRDRSDDRSATAPCRSGTGARCPSASTDARISLSADGKKLTIDPPRTGWQRGDRYVALVRGGSKGLVGLAGEKVECDAAFYFLRQHEALDTPDHEHAFPGDDHDERVSNATRLEGIRQDLRGAFDYFARARHAARRRRRAVGVHGDDEDRARDGSTVAAHSAADRSDDRSGDRPRRCADRAVGQRRRGRSEGPAVASSMASSLSGSQLFEFTAPMNAATMTERPSSSTRSAAARPMLEPATVELLADKTHLVVTPKSAACPRRRRTRSCSARHRRMRSGQTPVLMPIGHFLRAQDAGARRRSQPDPRDRRSTTRSRSRPRAQSSRRARHARPRQGPRGVAVHDDDDAGARSSICARRRRRSRSIADPANIDEADADAGARRLPDRHRLDRQRQRRLLRHDQDGRSSSTRRRARGAATAATRFSDIKFTMTMPKTGTGPCPS